MIVKSMCFHKMGKSLVFGHESLELAFLSDTPVFHIYNAVTIRKKLVQMVRKSVVTCNCQNEWGIKYMRERDKLCDFYFPLIFPLCKQETPGADG